MYDWVDGIISTNISAEERMKVAYGSSVGLHQHVRPYSTTQLTLSCLMIVSTASQHLWF